MNDENPATNGERQTSHVGLDPTPFDHKVVSWYQELETKVVVVVVVVRGIPRIAVAEWMIIWVGEAAPWSAVLGEGKSCFFKVRWYWKGK
jgi:hypothetical protein